MDIPVTPDLGRAIDAEIREQALTQKKIADRGGPSGPTMTKILKGEGPPISPSTADKLERALGWPEGAIARLARAQARRRGDLPDETTQAQLDAAMARAVVG